MLLALRTCKRPVARSTSSQRSATSSEAPEAVAVSNQDRRSVPMPRAVLLGGLDESLDLPRGPEAVAVSNQDRRGVPIVAVSNQDRRGVPMPRAVLLGGLDEPLDLPVGEIFTAALANCYIYSG